MVRLFDNDIDSHVSIVILHLGDTLRTSFIHGLSMAVPSRLGQNCLNFFAILHLEVFGAPIQLMESSCHPEVVEGGDARKVDYYFLIKAPCKLCPGVIGCACAIPLSMDLLDEEESRMNREGCEHPCQGNVSPVGVVGEQSEEVDQVGHHVHSW